jgi:hypothetical protein
MGIRRFSQGFLRGFCGHSVVVMCKSAVVSGCLFWALFFPRFWDLFLGDEKESKCKNNSSDKKQNSGVSPLRDGRRDCPSLRSKCRDFGGASKDDKKQLQNSGKIRAD